MCDKEIRRSRKRTFYDVLGIPQDADNQVIKSAYYHMARLFHPDKNPETSETVKTNKYNHFYFNLSFKI